MLQSSYHSSNVIITLQELNNLGFVGWLHTGKAASSTDGLSLFMEGQIVKFTSSVGSAANILFLREDADTSADSNGSSLVVT